MNQISQLIAYAGNQGVEIQDRNNYQPSVGLEFDTSEKSLKDIISILASEIGANSYNGNTIKRFVLVVNGRNKDDEISRNIFIENSLSRVAYILAKLYKYSYKDDSHYLSLLPERYNKKDNRSFSPIKRPSNVYITIQFEPKKASQQTNLRQSVAEDLKEELDIEGIDDINEFLDDVIGDSYFDSDKISSRFKKWKNKQQDDSQQARTSRDEDDDEENIDDEEEPLQNLTVDEQLQRRSTRRPLKSKRREEFEKLPKRYSYNRKARFRGKYGRGIETDKIYLHLNNLISYTGDLQLHRAAKQVLEKYKQFTLQK
jgi:hypothetical protein